MAKATLAASDTALVIQLVLKSHTKGAVPTTSCTNGPEERILMRVRLSSGAGLPFMDTSAPADLFLCV